MPQKTNLRMEVVMKPIDELIPYNRNARQHSLVQIICLKESISQFGFTNPVLIHSSGRIIAGHGRVEAAKQLGFKQVPCIVMHDLSEAQVRAYTIADNQLPSMATWDYDILAAEIDELREEGFDMLKMGFTQEELDELLGSPDEDLEVTDEEEEKKKPESDTTICPKCHHEFVL
jgi:ParB-like chromosome segregation protein Spo0J